MDAVRPVAQELSAALSDEGSTRSHEALSLLLPLLPLDVRARAACVCRAWRTATSNPLLWEELSFKRCAARVCDATLARLCARAGAALRTLDLEADACKLVCTAGLLAALRDGGCTGLLRLSTLLTNNGRCLSQVLDAADVQELVAACPMLQYTACTVWCSLSDAAAVDAAAAATALSGPVTLECWGDSARADLTQLADYLRISTTVTSLKVVSDSIGDAGAAQLAQCLRVNPTLTSLVLGQANIGDAGTAQLAECLRVNTTLTNLELYRNGVGAEGATRLAECLRVNATLTSLNLFNNSIGDAGATQLADCLRINTTLKSLNLSYNGIGAEGAGQLAECLRANATLTELNLGSNQFFEAGARQLAECLHVNTTLASLNLNWNGIDDAGATHLAQCLRVNVTLTNLELLQNCFGDAGATQLAESLRQNATLTSLVLGFNGISEEVMHALRQACAPQCALCV